MATCRDCALWNRVEAMDKIGRILKDRPAKCLWVSTEVYPKSIRRFMNDRRPVASYMTANDGHGCGQFVKFVKG